MTEKQETILTVALRLFAGQGYENTPTSQIAKQAGVSEGLIFRHFENKEGLLRALITDGQTRVQVHLDRIARQNDAKSIIAQLIDLPLTIVSEEREFWTLQFILKYKSQFAAALKAQTNYFGTLIEAVTQAFAELGYEHPAQETELLLLLLDGLTSHLLMHPEITNASATVQFIKAKYNV